MIRNATLAENQAFLDLLAEGETIEARYEAAVAAAEAEQTVSLAVLQRRTQALQERLRGKTVYARMEDHPDYVALQEEPPCIISAFE